MPIYAFECSACGHQFDRLQKLSDTDPSECPSCGHGGGIRRQMTAPSFRLAGSGWYETDFKSDKDKRRNLAGDAGVGGGKPEGGKSDAAPAPAAASSDKGMAPKTPSESKSKPKPPADKA